MVETLEEPKLFEFQSGTKCCLSSSLSQQPCMYIHPLSTFQGKLGNILLLVRMQNRKPVLSWMIVDK